MSKKKKSLKSIESLKNQIEKHFKKIEKDFQEKNEVLGKYHIKEIDKSLLKALAQEMEFINKIDSELLQRYKQRLQDFEDKFSSLD
jgi:uncharacterized membrane protein (UPF0182 family)